MKKHFLNRRALTAAIAACLTLPLYSHVQAQSNLELKITAPAGAGGGWDGASRALQQVMTATGAAKTVQVVNVPGQEAQLALLNLSTALKGMAINY